MSGLPPALSPLRVAERPAVDARTFACDIVSGYAPVVLRGQVSRWEAVRRSAAGNRATAEYLAGFGGGKPLDVMIGPPEIAGRFFYSDDMTGFNFARKSVPLAALLGELLRLAENCEERPPALYASSATAPEHLPGWEQANPLELDIAASARLWIGNATRVATHYDTSINIACVVAGRRRFTLFPPDQLRNLYVGPLDRTMAGPPSSMVDPDDPDFARFPRFAEAARHAVVAELEPGDAIFIPPIWWHHVRALDRFNVIVNYWWEDRSSQAFLALVHAISAVRDLPTAEKAAWRSWFDHLVFDEDAHRAADHLPQHARTVLDAPSAGRTERIRQFLVGMLQR